LQVREAGNLFFLQLVRGYGSYAHWHIVQLLLALLSRHHYLLQLDSVRRVKGGCGLIVSARRDSRDDCDGCSGGSCRKSVAAAMTQAVA